MEAGKVRSRFAWYRGVGSESLDTKSNHYAEVGLFIGGNAQEELRKRNCAKTLQLRVSTLPQGQPLKAILGPMSRCRNSRNDGGRGTRSSPESLGPSYQSMSSDHNSNLEARSGARQCRRGGDPITPTGCPYTDVHRFGRVLGMHTARAVGAAITSWCLNQMNHLRRSSLIGAGDYSSLA